MEAICVTKKEEVKRKCISFKGVELWNSADLKLKQCTSFIMLQKIIIYIYTLKFWLQLKKGKRAMYLCEHVCAFI